MASIFNYKSSPNRIVCNVSCLIISIMHGKYLHSFIFICAEFKVLDVFVKFFAHFFQYQMIFVHSFKRNSKKKYLKMFQKDIICFKSHTVLANLCLHFKFQEFKTCLHLHDILKSYVNSIYEMGFSSLSRADG